MAEIATIFVHSITSLPFCFPDHFFFRALFSDIENFRNTYLYWWMTVGNIKFVNFTILIVNSYFKIVLGKSVLQTLWPIYFFFASVKWNVLHINSQWPKTFKYCSTRSAFYFCIYCNTTTTNVNYLSVIDADGDIVRCRFPTSSNSNECGYLCDGLPGSSLDSVCICMKTLRKIVLKNQ